MASLYIKLKNHRGIPKYAISRTYPENGALKSRDLMDLDPHPSAFINYFGRHGFGFDPRIEENLLKLGVEVDSDELERIFRPFLRPDVKQMLDSFTHNRKSRLHISCELEDLAPDHRKVHLFDARRLYFLRFGRTDSGELSMKPWKWLNVFFCKSRDEIESDVAWMERRLPPGEYARYVYAALGVALQFPVPLRDYPAALDLEKVDELVIEALCRLNSDDEFFAGVDDRNGGLSPYLLKYAWLYFDNEFQPDIWFDPRRFFNSRSSPPAPEPQPMNAGEAYAVLGISAEKFSSMSRRDLVRAYRSKAKEIHPDTGGDHEEFLKLTRAYEALLLTRKKPKTRRR